MFSKIKRSIFLIKYFQTCIAVIVFPRTIDSKNLKLRRQIVDMTIAMS